MTTHRQHTRVIVQIDSHNNGHDDIGGQTYDVSKDCIGFSTSKSTKAMGRFQLTLVPRRNYNNLLFPNDVVNIYVDPGDGVRGFVRLVLGYIDRIETTETVNEAGAANTTITLLCSDFQKAIDKTCIYFNPQMRTLLDERFVRTSSGPGRPTASNLGGIALRNAGLTMFGSPADFVENMLRVLLGFNQQWQLPESYARVRSDVGQIRRRNVQKAKQRLPTQIKDAIATLGFDPQQIDQQIDNILERSSSVLEALDSASDEMAELKASRLAAQTLRSSADLFAFQSLVRAEQDSSLPIGIHDLLNTDFIESMAIDGFHQSQSIVQSMNATLSQFIYGHCNEMVNELIFDLRPISEAGGLSDGPYSKEPDELGINVKGIPDSLPSTVPAVKYEPCVIFREYPWSVVERVDLSNIFITGNLSAGVVSLGPVFAMNPNVEGRHVYEYAKPLHPQPNDFLKTTKPRKHIDVVVVHNTDVVSSTLGRSDEDVFNVFQMYATSVNSAQGYRDVMNAFCPLVNQISVARHGLRVREVTTDFANYPPGNDAKEYRTPRQNLVRWQLLFDHWYQHNHEYRTGSITMRGRPEIRVGYRLDWAERNESFYVEAVSHQWQYPGPLTTTVEVSRGQRNDPFPAYVPPVFLGKDNTVQTSSGNRSQDGRLALYTEVQDLRATSRATDRGDNKRDVGRHGLNTSDLFSTLRLLGGRVILPYVDNDDRGADVQTDDISLAIPDLPEEDDQ